VTWLTAWTISAVVVALVWSLASIAVERWEHRRDMDRCHADAMSTLARLRDEGRG